MFSEQEKKLLRQAFDKEDQAFYDSIPEKEVEKITFTPRFEHRMDRLLRRGGGATVVTRTRVRRLVVLAAALILMAALAISGSAVLRSIDVEDFKRSDGYSNETTRKYLSAVDLFDNKIDLYYVDSLENQDGAKMDRYVDELENEFIYNDDGSLHSYSPSEETAENLREKVVIPTYGKTEKLRQKQAKELAAELLYKFVGEEFKNYQFYYLQDIDTTKNYYIGFAKYYKNEIVGEIAIAGFKYDGTVTLLANLGVENMKDFDSAVLENMSDKTLRTFVVEKLQEKYPKCEYVRHEILNKYIRKIDGKLGILFETRGHYIESEQNTNFTELDEIFYPFPDQAAAVKK